MSSIVSNLQAVHHAIDDAARAVSRATHEVRLLAVSKTFDAAAVLAAADAGQLAFGENYVQEAQQKILQIRASRPDLILEWHFIGPIQSNKTRPIAASFDWVHSVENERIARRLSEQRSTDLPLLNVCLQVNISDEASKSGAPVADVVAIAKAISTLPQLRLRGLMAIPAPSADASRQRMAFRQVRLLLMQCREAGLDLDTLSMGMSGDLAAAIAEGATLVRIGSAIFGSRSYAA